MAGTSATAKQAVFAPLDGGDRVEAVIERLTGALSLGLIADGEQLPGESELAAALGVATVTLREALSQLRNQGLIETRRGRGGGSFASVSKGISESLLRKRLKNLGAHDLRDLGDMQLAIGSMAAVRAAQRADAQHLRHLEDLVEAFALAQTAAERRRADGRFHVELAAAAQSTRLAMLEMNVQAEQGDLLWIGSAEASKAIDMFHRKAVAEHREILDAIKAGDANRARAALERHVEDGVERLLDLHFLLNEE